LPDREDLYLHLQIDRGDRRDLLHHHDTENYLTPIVRHLGARRFALVSGTKRVGGGSHLLIGVAESGCQPDGPEWGRFAYAAHSGAGSKAWKVALRDGLLAAGAAKLPPGAVAVHLAWRCSSARAWMNLWKPTADAMGPVLGEPDPNNPFNPADDRIVSLSLHRLPDDALGWAVETALLWRHELHSADHHDIDG
jgi:hypothetical protein